MSADKEKEALVMQPELTTGDAPPPYPLAQPVQPTTQPPTQPTIVYAQVRGQKHVGIVRTGLHT